jgi:tRNA A-37 threonylcarbamoyl transferase component Bud32/tetratricopeptide (TPR) repeat protein
MNSPTRGHGLNTDDAIERRTERADRADRAGLVEQAEDRPDVATLEVTNTASETEPDSLATMLDERVPKLNIGSTIPGTHLRIIRWLGQGGMGVVFEVRHLDIERRYAAKLLNIAKNPARARRFRDEARTISQIGSPWIVEIFDFMELPDGRLMYVMELVPGPSLYALQRDEGPLPLPRLLGLARQVCKGLHDAHAVGFIHRDIKPENIMLGFDAEGREQVKLVDFGLAALLEGPKIANNSGTPAYMSPEQCRGLDADERTDIYSLGATLYELACGQLPFDGPDERSVRASHLGAQPLPPSERIIGGLPPGLDQIILRCMAKQPRDRYASAAELEAALIELQLELRVRTPFDDLPAPKLEDTRRQRRLDEGLLHLRSAEQQAERRRLVVGVALLLVVAVAAAIGWKVEAQDREQAMSLGQREIETLSDRARGAAARASWVYPPATDPKADTAYRVLLEIDALELPGAEVAAHALRQEFAGTLVNLGDLYWDREGGHQFAVEYYVQALLFEPELGRANQRANLSPVMLLALSEQAKRGDFTPEQLVALAPLTSLAESDPQQRIEKLTAVRDDRRRKKLDVDDVELLLVGLGAQSEAEPAEATPAPLPDIVPGEGEAGDETEPEPGEPESESGETEPEPESGETDDADPTLETDTDSGKQGATKAKSTVTSAKAAYDAGHDADAERLFHQALAHDRRNLDALVGLHRIHFDRGQWRQALDFARRAASLRPKRAELQMFVGDSCMKVLDYDCARAHYLAMQRLGDARAAQRLHILEARLGDSK